jgi:hypothetical protein
MLYTHRAVNILQYTHHSTNGYLLSTTHKDENTITLYSKPENDLYRYKYVVLKITYFYNCIYL